MALAQLRQTGVAAHFKAELELDSGIGDQARAPLNNLLLELEPGNAIDQESAWAIVAVIDDDLIALRPKLFGSRQAGRTGADDTDRLRSLPRWADGSHPAAFPSRIGNVLLDRADRDCAVAGLLDHAAALAEAVLRADAATDFGEVVGRLTGFVGFLKASFCSQQQPVRYVVVNRTMDLAEGDAALGTAGGLFRRLLGGELFIDLLKIARANSDVTLPWHIPLHVGEFQHAVCHSRAS